MTWRTKLKMVLHEPIQIPLVENRKGEKIESGVKPNWAAAERRTKLSGGTSWKPNKLREETKT
jgi:hypothetical protein